VLRVWWCSEHTLSGSLAFRKLGWIQKLFWIAMRMEKGKRFNILFLTLLPFRTDFELLAINDSLSYQIDNSCIPHRIFLWWTPYINYFLSHLTNNWLDHDRDLFMNLSPVNITSQCHISPSNNCSWKMSTLNATGTVYIVILFSRMFSVPQFDI